MCIGAGSVVTKNIPNFSIVYGNWLKLEVEQMDEVEKFNNEILKI